MGSIIQNQCKAITQKGAQCKRKAIDDSGYCTQHKKIAEKKEIKKEVDKKTIDKKSSFAKETFNGHEVFTGSQGGKYYFNKSGKKVYIKH
ncbi:MAG: DUF5763 domain-containing protein [Bacteroidota bacterium]